MASGRNLIQDYSMEFQREAGVFPPSEPGKWYTDGVLLGALNTAKFKTTPSAHGGAWVIETENHENDGSPPPDNLIPHFGQQVDIVDLGTYTDDHGISHNHLTPRNLRVWIRTLPGGTGQKVNWVFRFEMINAYVDPSATLLGEPFDFRADVLLTDITEDWQQFDLKLGYVPTFNTLPLIAPHGWEKTVAFRTNPPAGPRTIHRFYEFDELTWMTTAEEEDVVKRREIKEAFITAIAGITTGGGYSHTIVESLDGIKPLRSVTGYPSVQTTYGPERKEGAELQRRRGHLQLDTLVIVQGTAALTSTQVCDEVCGDIQVATEPQTGGQHLGLGYIDNIGVIGIEPVELTEPAHRGTRVWLLTTMVVYRHNLGAP